MNTFWAKSLFILVVVIRAILPLGADTALAANGVSATELSAEQIAYSPAELLILTNSQRVATGLPELVINEQLNQAAQAKAHDMITRGYWAHFRPLDGKTPWSFIEEAGYSYRSAGENLAKGFKTPEGITTGWMKSPGHRANILSPKYKEVGYACVWSVDASGERTLITVQLFGSK